ncbi:MAG: polyprenyl synthetase family protein [Oscillospiraceae bacterium]|nr:polyprenyl synthetase family protein [Oscillospiraceae bacterium]
MNKYEIEQSLEKYISNFEKCNCDILIQAMKYSLMAGGKRIRPQLLLEFCRICGGSKIAAMPFACALEMIHTYSLIHDDLPCMDNASLRRGKPSNHKIYGEATALLAGDALFTLAFEIMLSNETICNLGDCGATKAATAASVLASHAGPAGMVGGQFMDLFLKDKDVNLKTLEKIDEKKTGCLIMAASKMGCIIAGVKDERLLAAGKFAKNLGLAFQIVDDILDATSNSAALGKTVRNDEALSRFNYISLLGLAKSKKLVKEITDNAIDSLKSFDGDTSILKNLAISLASRSN